MLMRVSVVGVALLDCVYDFTPPPAMDGVRKIDCLVQHKD